MVPEEEIYENVLGMEENLWGYVQDFKEGLQGYFGQLQGYLVEDSFLFDNVVQNLYQCWPTVSPKHVFWIGFPSPSPIA